MAGLLDFLNTDDGRLGIGLLAAAGPRSADQSGFGQRLQDAFGAQDNWKKTALSQKMGDLQYQSAIQSLEAATRRNKLINDMLAASNQPEAPQVPQQAQGQTQGQPSYFDSMPPAMTAGIENAPPAPVNAPQQRPMPAPQMGQVPQVPGNSGGLFRDLPRQLVATDLALNEGKGIPGYINDRTKPQKEMVSGVLVDKNNLPANFSMPIVSQNGTASQLIPDPSAPGGFRVIAPQGAVDTYKGYQGASAEIAAAHDLVKVDMPDGSTQMVPKSVALMLTQIGGNKGGIGRSQTPEANKFGTGRAESAVKYEDALNSRVAEGGNLNIRLQESLAALDKFKSGGGAPTRLALAKSAQAIGAPQALLDKIAGGDMAAMQEFNKLAVQQALETLKSSMGPGQRVAQQEFLQFSKNNPNLDTDPNAIRKIADFQTKLYNRDMEEQKAFNAYIGNGGNPASFPMVWQGEQAKRGFTNPNLDSTKGASLPKPMAGMVRNGYKFKGGDPSSPSSWEKQ